MGKKKDELSQKEFEEKMMQASNMLTNHHHHQQQQQQQQQQHRNGEVNEIEDFLNILIDENNPSNNNNNKNIQYSNQQQQQQQQQQQNSFNVHQNQSMQLNIPQIQRSPNIPISTSPRLNQASSLPQVKIKCEENNVSDYPHSDGDGFVDDMSPFHSGVSSPGSSCMSGPGSPVMMDSSGQPPYRQNYLTPESAFYMQPGSPTNSGNQSGDSAGSAYKYDPRPLGRKKRRTLVPDDKKNSEYWEKRKRNNIAARRSREERRTKELQTFETMKHLQQENNALKQTVKMLMESQNELQKEVYNLRHCLELSQAMYNKPMQGNPHQM